MQTREQILVGLMSIAYAVSLTYIGGPSNAELVLASVLLAGGCCYKFLPAFSGQPFQWSHVLTAMAAYVMWLAVLVYTSTLPENSIHFAWLLAGFAMVTYLAADLEDRSWFVALLLFSLTGFTSAAWGIVEFVSTARRADGPIVDPSSWCAIMNLFVFAMVYASLCREEKWIRITSTVGLTVFAVAAFSAYSRVGTLVTFASAAFIVGLAARYRRLWSRLAIVVVIICASYGVVHSYASTLEASNAEGYTLDLQKKGWHQRIAMWRAGLEIYEQHPLVGSGPGTFKVQYPKFRTHNDLLNFGNFVHNDYLQYLLEGGPLLLSFLLGFVGLLVSRLARSASRLAHGNEASLAPVSLTVAIGTLLVASLMSFPMYQMQTEMMAGLLFGRYLKVSGLLFPAQIRVSSPRAYQVGVVAGTAVLCLVPVLDAISSQLVLGGDAIPFVNHLTRNSQTYVQTLSLLSTVRSVDPDNRFEMATIYRASFDQQQDPTTRRALAIAAAQEYQAGLELNPYHEKARRYFAEFLEQNPWLTKVQDIHETPEALYRAGVAIYPVYIEPYLDFAAFLRRNGRADEAYALLARGALPWADLRHGEYYPARLKLFRMLLIEARARNDRTTLQELLSHM